MFRLSGGLGIGVGDMLFKDVLDFFEGCRGFQGGRVTSWRYEFHDFGRLNVVIGLEGRFLEGLPQRCRVELKMLDVVEVRSDFVGGRGNYIAEEVEFSPSEIGGYCLAFGCAFSDIPRTLDAIRRRSDCYLIGKAFEMLALSE